MNVDLFEHWIFWAIMMVLALVFLAVAKARSFNDTAKASVDGKKWTLGFDKIWWAVNYGRAIAAVLIIGLTLMMFGCNADWNEGDKTPVATHYCPSMMEGSIDMPSMADVALACNIDVKEAGLWRDGMTDAEAQALCSAPMPNNNNFGGGGAYGGRYLTGSFHFEFDANCQQIPGVSYVTLFSPEHYPVTGGLTGDGKIGMGSIGGTGISGSIVDGKLVDAKIVHGDGKHHIKGNFNGGFVLR